MLYRVILSSTSVLAQPDGMAEILGAGGFLCVLLFSILVGVGTLVAVVWAVIDIVKREFENDTEQIIWVLVVLCMNWLGVIIYALAGRSRGRRTDVGGDLERSR